MSRAVVDQATRDAVSVEGLGRTLFVEAGAGTGKTSQLVERIANLVLVRGVSLANVAAITFTEAAAAELQGRIRVRFEQEAARAAALGDDDLLARCRAAIDEADMAAISTLHGFASRLLGEFAVEAGLPPRVHVNDEVSSQLAQEQRWERFVDALYDDPDNEDVLVRAALVGVALEPRYQGHATLKDVASEFSQNWDRIEAMATGSPPPLGAVDFADFDAAVAQVLALPERCTDVDDKFYVHLVGTVLPEMVAISSMEDPGRKLRAVCATRWTTGKGGRKASWGGDVDGCKALLKAVNEAADEVRATAADEVLRHLLVHVAKEVWEAAQARRAEGGLEFHDLLVLARDMLRRSTLARSRLHERYTHLLLDEFQDTDPIQIELAMLIAASVTGELPDHWSELQVEDGRLFFVGDPKQSIYRFRRADIGLFLAARRRFEGDGRVLQLVTNFRTVAPILDWVNSLFGHVMDEELEGRQPRYERLSAHRPADSGADHVPVLLGGPHPDPKVKAEPLREAEARSVAGAISRMREQPERWPVHDRGGWRPARLADVAILVPARTSVPYLRAELEAADIPYRLATGTLVYDTQEVRDALSTLRAVDDPTDELSLVAALRSPLYACSDVDLFTFHEAGGRWNLRAEPPDEVPEDHPVRAALAHLRSLWEQRWWLGPAAMLDRVLRERHAHLLAFGDPRPKEVWHRLRFLVDQARAFEESGGGGLRAFVDWAQLQGADGARVHEPLLPETDDDAVRILTVHGSKGLEFPITILSGMTTKPGRRRSGVSVLWDESGPPEVSLRKGVATANHDPRADIELEMDEHEKMRLLYVATTRARDHLLVSCHHKAVDGGKAPDTYGARIWAYFRDHPELWRALDLPDDAEVAVSSTGEAQVIVVDAPEAPSYDEQAGGQLSLLPVDPSQPGLFDAAVAGAAAGDDDAAGAAPSGTLSEAERDEWIARRAALIDPQRTPRVVSATAVARQALEGPGVGAVDEDDDDADLPEAGTVAPRRRGRAGTAIGRAVHATLQVLDLADPRDLEAQVRRQCELESVPEHEETVAALVRSALDAPAVRAAAEHPHHKELFVSAPVGTRVIEGYVDLLLDTPEGLVVVDYKTDTVTGPAAVDEKLATYELQGAAYAAALEEVTGRPVVDCRFVFCSVRGPIERSVADLPGSIKKVRQIVEG